MRKLLTEYMFIQHTHTVIFVPVPLQWASRRAAIFKQHARGNWKKSQAVLLFVFGTKTGPKLEQDLDMSSLADEKINYILTPCRDFGDEPNNPNGTSATTCKVYEACKHIYHNFKADFIWRVDSDSYLNLHLFFSMSYSLPRHRLWMGRLRKATLISEDLLLSKHPNLQELYGLHQFGQYMSGMGSVFSWDVLEHIACWKIPPHQTWVEDVIVGMWLNPFQIYKVHRPDLFIPTPSAQQLLAVFGYVETKNITGLLFHYMRASDWKRIDDQGSLSLI